MAEIKTYSIGGPDNYPKAKPVRRTKSTARQSTPQVVSSVQSAPRDIYQGNQYDSQMSDIDRLRKSAAQRRFDADVEVSYPTRDNRSKTTSTGRSKPTLKATAQQASRSLTPKPASAPSRSPQPKPKVDLSADYPSGNGHGWELPEQHRAKPRYRVADTIQAAAHKKMLAEHAKLLEKADKPAPVKAKPKPAPKAPKINTRLKVSGHLSVVGGAMVLKSGADNLKNGNYLEGGLQTAQGGLILAEGANALETARKGLASAPATKLAKGLKVGGTVVGGFAALYDGTKAVQAYKSGNEVQAAERTGSAVINAVTACPVTAPIGIVGGLADTAMAVSGADDAMVELFSRSSKNAYDKQTRSDMKLGEALAGASTERLSQLSRDRRQYFVRGIEGLKAHRQAFAANGDLETVRKIDFQIARIRNAWK